MRSVDLVVPPLPLLVPAETFDGFSWCPSTTLSWRCHAPEFTVNDLADQLPVGMAFVLREPWDGVPTELAWLHLGRAGAAAVGASDAWVLAPYAIDDATDQLFAHRRPPTETFWLAADNLNALYWALHDWAHFHNHGPFDDRLATELQCDSAALAWLWRNRSAVGLSDARWETLRGQVLANHVAFRELNPTTRCPPPDVLGDAARLQRLA